MLFAPRLLPTDPSPVHSHSIETRMSLATAVKSPDRAISAAAAIVPEGKALGWNNGGVDLTAAEVGRQLRFGDASTSKQYLPLGCC